MMAASVRVAFTVPEESGRFRPAVPYNKERAVFFKTGLLSFNYAGLQKFPL